MTRRKPIHRADYRPPDYTVRRVEMTVDLHETATRVEARLSVARSPGTE